MAPFRKQPRPPLPEPAAAQTLRGGPQFERGLMELLDGCNDIASEALWQQLPKLVAKHWREFHHNQSPLSTLNMIRGCADEVLKIRLAQKRGMGGDDSKTLEDFQKLLEELGRPETDEEQQWGQQALQGWEPSDEEGEGDEDDDDDE